MATLSQRARHRVQKPKLQNKDFTTSSVSAFINHDKNKTRQSDSSNDEEFEDSKCMLELKDYLLKVCQDMDVLAKLKSLVGEHMQDVGLLVSQRVVNLPPQLLPPLYDALFDVVEWATEDEPTEELRSSFRFKFYLIISKTHKQKSADWNRGTIKNGEETVIYIKPEDEIFFELSSWSLSCTAGYS